MRSWVLSLLTPIFILPFFASAEIGDDGWCGICSNFFDKAEHAKVHADAKWCDVCQGFYLGVGSKSHVHIGDTSAEIKIDNAPIKPPDNPPNGDETPGGNGNHKQKEKSPLQKLMPWLWVVPLGLFVLSIIVSTLRRVGSGKRGFQFVDGVPEGLVFKRDVLVCAQDGVFDGGTSMVYEALFNNGKRWEPAFVKCVTSRSMNAGQRLEMVEFESGVLQRLEQTGVVPRVLVVPETVTLPGGATWPYYAMSAAQGKPWPEHGDLGGDTHAALAALCEALILLHENGIGRHDLKPQNIFWDSRRKRVTLLDFGSAIDHSGKLGNPMSGTMTGTKPWVPPASDGKILSELSPLSDNWVYGLIFCEALVGGIHAADRTLRRTPEKPEDRDWLRENLSRVTTPAIADAVVDGLFAFDKTRRMKLQEFLGLLREEWEV